MMVESLVLLDDPLTGDIHVQAWLIFRGFPLWA
ncbi:uncharacterized protein METZ01_LOCUS186754 [marine metagenome]|uniref:Uncharacterized protein n=1 Tax=marine metagenome TaxID=408172 RepID=A0A382D646_9ZZZZ